jgi:glycosyl hydrolase family 39 (putative alpha-L-iduronidase)
MRLRYGFNETDNWWNFAQGRERKRIWAKLRELDTQIIRIFLFDKHAPDPVGKWDLFQAYTQAVLEVGATPMITFAKFGPPSDHPRALRTFVTRCVEVVWGCIEKWGAENVRDWFWCVWNEPNNAEIGGGLSFYAYRNIYQEVAYQIRRCLEPYLEGRRALIGGPAVDGFQPGWLDWIGQFLSEIDDSLIGFVSWHRYGDWRPIGTWGAPQDEARYRRILMATTSEYATRAIAVQRLLDGRNILNVCGELNVHSHHDLGISRPYNQTVFGAAYYASALFHLLRGGADAELWWTATEDSGPFGVIHKNGSTTPVYEAKQLCTRHLRLGDRISFPKLLPDCPSLDAVFSRALDGRRSLVVAHLSPGQKTCTIPEALKLPPASCFLQNIDEKTRNRVLAQRFAGTITFEGYGVATVSTDRGYRACNDGS